MTRPVLQTAFIIVLLLAVTGAYLHYAYGYSHADLSGHAWGSDDAYISFRYAENLVNGHGLVYNPGERVEGYTNLLYVLISAVFIAIDPDIAYISTFILNLLLYAATFILLFWYLRQMTGDLNALLGVLAVSLSPLMWAWPSSGLETSAVVLVQLALFIAADYISRKPSSRLLALFLILSAVSLLLRADGFAFPLFCSMLIFIRGQYKQGIITGTTIILMFGTYIAVRYSYYGEILPNTYYAKVTGGVFDNLLTAKRRFIRMIRNEAFFLYLIPIAIGWSEPLKKIFIDRRPPKRSIPAVPLISVILLAYWFYVGGDIFNERFLIILIPLSIGHLVIESERLCSSRRLAIILLIIVIVQFKPFMNDRRFEYHAYKYDRWIELGKFLADEHPDATLATGAAGKIPFFSKLHTIDMLGLNDPHIARTSPQGIYGPGHNKYDPDYVFFNEPDLIASWGSKDLDLMLGMTRDRYRPEGYSLKYVVNSLPTWKEANIIDVADIGEENVQKLFKDGYTYFVLIKRNIK